MENQLKLLLKEKKINSLTVERVMIAASSIEKKYKLKKEIKNSKLKEWNLFLEELDKLDIPVCDKEKIKNDALKIESDNLRLR